jgi:hypothetical protein
MPVKIAQMAMTYRSAVTLGQGHQSGHDAEGPFSDKRSPVPGPPHSDQDDERALQDRVDAEESAHRLEVAERQN